MAPLLRMFLLAAASDANSETAPEASALLQVQPTANTSSRKIPRILHRVMMPRGDNGFYCSGPAEDRMRDGRADFYEHNDGWAEYVWGRESIQELLESSRELLDKEGLGDFQDVYESMDHWMYQQDSIRHLILYRFGGLYMDLDVDCQVNVNNLIGGHSLVFRQKGKTNFMAAERHHDFFLAMLRRIRDTFKNGLGPDDLNRPSAIALTGELQISAGLDAEYGLDFETLNDGDVTKGGVRILASEEVDNGPPGTAMCSHWALVSWGSAANPDNWQVQDANPDSPPTEADLAKTCPVVYDAKATWGAELIAKLKL